MERRISYFRQKGDSYIFAASLGLLLSLMMVAWIVVIILVKGLGFFWPRDVVAVTMTDGEKYMGEQWEEKTDKFFNEDGSYYMLDRFQLKIGNRDLYGLDFKWLKKPEVQSETRPEKALFLNDWNTVIFMARFQSSIFSTKNLISKMPI